MLKKLKNRIEAIGLSFKSQLIIFIILNVFIIAFGVLFYLFIRNVVVIAFFLVMIVGLDYVYLTRYKAIEKDNEEALLREWIGLVSFFKVYLKNNYNIYSSLKEISTFASSKLLDRLERLIDRIDNDKSVVPFIEFSREFKSLQIEQLMISLYQMIDEGNDSIRLQQFEIQLNKLRDETYQDELSLKERSLNSMTIFPLIGSGMIIVMITFGVISVIGDMVNGF